MYNNSSLIYVLFTSNLLLLFGAIAGFLVSRFWNKEKTNKKYLFIGLALLAFFVFDSSEIISAITSENTESFSGSYVEEYKDNSGTRLPNRMLYIFNDGNNKTSFKSDVFSIEKLVPEGFEENKNYTVYYKTVDGSKYIVGIEEIDLPNK